MVAKQHSSTLTGNKPTYSIRSTKLQKLQKKKLKKKLENENDERNTSTASPYNNNVPFLTTRDAIRFHSQV